MKTSDFYYDLPKELIAQTPLDERDQSRLMVLDRATGAVEHRHFYELPDLLRSGDCLVLNDSKVLPARLFGRRDTGGTTEVLLLKDMGENVWECMTKPGRKTRTGTHLIFGDGELSALVINEVADGNRLIKFEYDGVFMEVLDKLGQMPLPPYIHEKLEDGSRYQTVYSREPGSAAAPTAGLHFTDELLGAVRARGIKTVFVTLHVGLGTFRPVKENDIEDHNMHSEYCEIPEETARIINSTKLGGGRVVCVGTTSCRTIESFADDSGLVAPSSGWTDIIIYPGYRFKCMDALITNFHLPESTLLMLVSAFAGRAQVLAAYEEAIRQRYRFFSFGDAMFIE